LNESKKERRFTGDLQVALVALKKNPLVERGLGME
jgi:hypothetical protein